MQRGFKSKRIMKIILMLLNNKEKIYQLLDGINPEKLEKGIISIHQDIANKTFKDEIIEKLNLLDFNITLSKESITLELTKKIKVMFMDLEIVAIFTLKDYYLSFGNSNYGFFTNYSIKFDGLPSMMDKLPGGDSIKDLIINSFIKAGSKDIKWLSIVGDSIIVDLNKNEEFLRFKEDGILGMDIVNEIDLSNLRTEKERLLIDYILAD